MLRRPVRSSLAIPLALAAVAVACSNRRTIEGMLAASDRAVNVRCAVTERPAEFANANWDPCRRADAGPGDSSPAGEVSLGERFQCSVSANVDRVYAVRVECPGYQPLVAEVLVENCAGFFSRCDAVDAGTLVVQK